MNTAGIRFWIAVLAILFAPAISPRAAPFISTEPLAQETSRVENSTALPLVGLWEIESVRVATLTAILVGVPLIVAFLAQRSRREWSDNELRATQERVEVAAEAARLGIWLWDIGTGSFWLSDKGRELFGFSRNESVNYDAMLQRVHPEDRPSAEEATRLAIARKAPYRSEYRLLLPYGPTRWISASGRVDFDPSGNPTRMLGACIDVSDRRRLEEAARDLSGRLIHAQEDERRRIARDLHDDLNQQLALLSVELDILGRESEGELREQIERVIARTKNLSLEVHKLSYDLHPAKLDQLGIVAAGRSLCRELSQQSGIRISFMEENVPSDLTNDMALCLYRVTQESLQNMVRHSGTDE